MVQHLSFYYLIALVVTVVLGDVKVISPKRLNEEELPLSPTGETLLSSRELQALHPVNRSDVKLSLDTVDSNCYQDEDLHVLIRYTFFHPHPSMFNHDLIFILRNFDYEPIIVQKYSWDDVNLFSVPIDYFQVGGEKVYLQLYNNSTKTILDEQTLRFMNPCHYRPSLLQQYFIVPLTDNPTALLLSSGIAFLGKMLFDGFGKTSSTSKSLAVVDPSTSNSGDSPYSPKPSDHPFHLMQRYVKRLTRQANPVPKITYPNSPKLLTNSRLVVGSKFSLPSTQSAPIPTVSASIGTAEMTTSVSPLERVGAFAQSSLSSLQQQQLFSKEIMVKAVSVVAGILFLLLRSGKSMDSQAVPTSPTLVPEQQTTTISPKQESQHPILKDFSRIGQAAKNSLLLNQQTIQEFNKNPKVIASKKLWKTIAAVIIQSGLYILQKGKFKNAPKFFQHSGANDLPF